MKRQLLRFASRGHKENTIMETDRPSSSGRKSSPELFIHNLTLAHMKQSRRMSRLSRSISLLVRCAFVVLMGVAVLGAVDSAHAQQLLVSNFDQPDKFFLARVGVPFDDHHRVSFGAWTPLTQGFRTGVHGNGYRISGVNLHVRFANDPSTPLNLSVSIWVGHASGGFFRIDSLLYTLGRSQNTGTGVQVFSGNNSVILAPDTEYFIKVKATDANSSVLSLTYEDDEDTGSAPGWSIRDRVYNRSIASILPGWQRARDDNGDSLAPGISSDSFRAYPLKIRIWGEPRNSPTAFVSLTQVSEGQFKATATASAPSDIVLPITIINGVGAATVTIPAGSTESDVINVSRIPGTTFPVIVNIGNLPNPPAGYELFKTPTRLPIQVLEGLSGGPTPVGERTPQVRDAIVRAAGVSADYEVTEAHLAGIRGLPSGTPLSSTPIQFQIGDFSGLTALATLEMNGHAGIILPDGIFDDLTSLERLSLYNSKFTTIPNAVLGLTSLKILNMGYHRIASIPAGAFDQLTQLNTLILDGAAYANTFTSLPDGVFDNLTSLTTLDLAQNKITSLPDGVFDHLTSLERLNLERNSLLSSLPDGVFDNLTSLISLNLSGVKLTSLPDGVFDNLTSLTSLTIRGRLSSLSADDFSGLSSLTSLDLSGNQLTSLPAGIFSQLPSLTSLRLGRNAVDPLPLTVSLEKVGEGQFKAIAPTGAPFDIVLPVSARNGSISGGANTLTIPKGSVESTSLTVTRTLGTTAAITVDIGTLPGLPTDVNRYGTPLHQGYTLVKSDDLPLFVISRLVSGFIPVSERTPQVRDAIVAAVPGVNSANEVTEAHLAAITYLDLSGQSITSLKVGDFEGLTGLEELHLGSNQLTILPEDIFDGLTVLTTLRLYGNQLSSLPEDIFDELTSLTWIQLGYNRFTTLPSSIFDGLTKLTVLAMRGNQFTTLPDGIFEGLTGLTRLHLEENAAYPLPLTVSLEKVGDNQFKAVAPTGAPFDIVLPLNIANGTIYSGATTITIPAGSLESEPLTVLRTSDRTSTVTVNIGTLPGLPTNHSGYSLVKSDDLPLTFTGLDPVFTPVSERTPQVRDQIVLLTRARFQQGISANNVTPVHVRSITYLSLRNKSITSLKTGDFSGMPSLETLILDNNSITSLPEDVFDGLSALKELWLQSNALTSLPVDVFEDLSALEKLQLASNSLTSLPEEVFDGLSKLATIDLYNNSLSSLPEEVFDGLSALKTLFLRNNSLSSLPEEVFDGLSNLTSLYLAHNSLTSLPGDVFEGLSNLTSLRLSDNDLTNLPEGIFEGLSNLTSLSMYNNPGRLRVTLSLQKFGEGQFKAVAPTGAPFEMVLPLTVTNGSINGGATSITIPAGSVESEILTVTRASDTTNAVAVDIGTLPGLPSGHSDYRLVKSPGWPLEFTELGGTTLIRVSERTPQVRDAIMANLNSVRVNDMSIDDVSLAHLKAITYLDLQVKSITSLKSSDFEGLTSLRSIGLWNNDLTTLPAGIFEGLTALTRIPLYGNDLTTLPAGIFEGLTSLTTIELQSNNLTTLPAGIFEGLTSLTTISLSRNDLTTLPDGIFDGLTALTAISLWGNDLTTLPDGIFDGLTALATIDLSRNDLTTLPDGIFEGLTSLTTLKLRQETTDLSLTVSLEKVADGQFKAVAPTGAPFNIVLPLTVTNGSISGDVTSIMIPIGSVESDVLTVNRPAGSTAAVTVDIGTLPGLPTDADQRGSALHQGYELAKSPDLPLEVISAGPTVVDTQRTSVNIPDPNLRAKIEDALGKTSGAPISTAEMATLTSLTAQDARISDLTGLETATNLTTLKLGNNSVSDISALAGLTSLTELQLWDNPFSNLSILASLTNLTKLYIWRNGISDISVLAGLTSLTQLKINENTISNISILSRLTNLTELSLKDNAISDISALAGLTNLTELQIGNNTITNITPVQNLTKLVWLDMPNNSISDISVVQNLTKLAELYFQNNAVSDLSPLVANTGFGEFTELNASGNPLNYPSIYTHIPALQAKNVYIEFDNRVATTPVKISGDTQSGNTGTTLAQPFVVEVQDASRVAFAGVPVTFAVTAGGGTLSATNTTTNTNGRAESTLTLGNSAGTNTVRVSVQGVSQTATFTATAATTNTAPTFTDGTSTTRTIAENTAADVNIGNAVAATDADNDTLTYTLSGTDAALFDINSTTGQLKTQTALDYETKSSYSVTVSVSDGNGGSDSITVTINVTDVDEQQTDMATYEVGDDIPLPSGFNTPRLTMGPGRSLTADNGTYTCVSADNCIIQNGQVTQGTIEVTTVAANTAPVFTDDTSTTRSIAENTAAGVNIGAAIAATDADNDTLTYTLGGTDAASFSINSSTGQLQTKSALDYETKTVYTVTITVSDGSLTDTITVTINVTDIDDTAKVVAAVNIPDPNLRAEIEAALGKKSGDPITPTEMATLTSLTAQDASISNLTGLETATNLTTLKLGDNSISDISALAGLTNLTELQLWDNQISNLSILASLTNLTKLYIWGNSISDISALAGLTSLTQLKISENTISNISILSRLTNLTELSLKANAISDISALAGLTNLTELQIGNNTITNITPVQNLTKLVWLDMPNNSISDISVVQNLTKLAELYFQNNAVSDLSPLVANTGFGEFTELNASGNPLNYPSIYTHIPALQAKNVYIEFDNRVATTPVKISGDTQSGNTGTTLAQPFVVEVQDASRVAFAGVPVTFAVTAGGGTLNVSNTTTNANGRAESTLTLGNTAGTNTVHVSVQGISTSVTFTATATTTNTAPTFTDGTSTTRTIAENTAADVNIGNAVAATDADNDTLTYTLSGTDAASFSINSSTGQLQTKSALDYETKTTYTATVTVSDGSLSDTITVTISVTDIDETPAAQDYIQGPWLWMIASGADIDMDYLAEESNGTITEPQVAQNGVNEGDNLGELQWTRGQIYPSTYCTFWTGCYSDNVNHVVNAIGLSENHNLNLYSAYALINIISTRDQNGVSMGVGSDDAVKVWLNGTVVHRNNVDRRTTGIQDRFSVNLKAGDNLLLVKVSDNFGDWGMFFKIYLDEADFTTAIPNVDTDGQPPDTPQPPVTTNTAPVFTDGASTARTIAENTAAGRNIGSPVSATDADNDTLTYTLSGTDAASFSINSSTGQLQTKAALDYETKTTYTVTVTVSDGSLTDTITVTINVNDVADTPVVSTLTPVCDRTPQVRDAIVAAVPGVSDCSNVTETHLAAIRDLLDLRDKNISALKPGDFEGLSSLQELRLESNQLRALPADIFSGLSSLRRLYLGNNQLTSLPPDVFSELTALHDLYLHNNQLTSLPVDLFAGLSSLRQINLHTSRLTNLPADIFSGLSSLTQLFLRNNKLTSLPADLFSGLSSLQYLYLDGNRLTSLPADLFSGLPSLTQLLLNKNQMSTLSVGMFRGLTASTQLWLQGNTVDPLPLTISLEKVGDNQFKASVPAGAPFTITIPINVANGTISSGVSTLTIPQGSVESGRLTVTRTAGTTAAVTVDIGTLPGLPTNHQGYQLTRSANLPLEIFSSAANRAPTFTEGASTTRAVAENTAPGVNIGAAIAATDADNDTLTYTLSGTDAASFSINSSTGQLQTKSALDYETKTTYTATVTVSDGSLTDTITVTINVTDVDEAPTDIGVCKVGDILAPGESCTYPGTDATFSVLDNGHSQWNIPDLPSWLAWINQTSIGGSMRISATINNQDYHFVAEEVSNDSWEIKEIGEDRPEQPETPEQPEQPGDVGETPTLTVSTASSLTEATLHGGVATLTLSGGTYESTVFDIRRSLTVSGITGADFETFSVVRVSDTQATVELEFDGNISTSGTLTFNLESDAIANYEGAALTSQISVPAVTESVTASTAAPLTEATLDESVVTLTLSGRKFERNDSTVRTAVSVSGIAGVTVQNYNIDRESDTEVTVELTFNGNINTNSTLTFTVGADAIAGYDGAALTAQVPVSAGTESLDASTPRPLTEATLNESVVTLTLNGGKFERNDSTVRTAVSVSGIAGVTVQNYNIDRESDTEVTVELTFNGNINTNSTLTFTVGAEAIAGYNGPALTAQVPVSAGTESLDASTPQPLTEATLNESVVTLTLNGRKFERNDSTVRTAVSVSGIAGVTVQNYNIDRESDTEVTVELTFNGNINTDGTLTFTVGADAIAGYDGAALTAQVSVSASEEPVEIGGGTPTLRASTPSPLTEATLNESVVTLTLTGGTYESTTFDIRRSLTVSDITGADFEPFSVVRVSDTQATVELEFDGNISTNSTLTFTLRSDAIANYDGDALTSQISVSALPESVVASTASPLTEATLDESVVTLTLTGATYERAVSKIRDAVTVSGINGVTMPWHEPDRESNTEITLELEFDGTDFDTNSTLTFIVGAGAIAGYNGPALTAQLSVSASTETPVVTDVTDGQTPVTPQQPQQQGGGDSTLTLRASTPAPLTEATLHESVVTLTLTGRHYVPSYRDIRSALTITGIDGATYERYGVDRISDTEATVELEFNGDFDTNATLTFTVRAGAIADYKGPALTTQLPVTASTESIVASTDAPLTEMTLNGSIVTLTLTGRHYVPSYRDIRSALTITGIDGATYERYGVDRISDTEATVELEFNGDFDTNATLTFTVRAGAIADYKGPALTTQLPVTASTESIVASTDAPLTEMTLNGSIVTLTLTGRHYVPSYRDIRSALTITGIDGATYERYGVDRISDTEATVELEFNGDFDTDATLTFTVGAGAIADYNGPALTVQVSVTASTESIVATTASPLTEATLDESVVTLTLTGRNYARSIFDIRDAVTVSGINGVTIPWHDPDRESDTELTLELEFDGTNFDSTSTLIFTVGADAIADYNGPALTAQITVTATEQVLRAPSGISLIHVPLRVTAVDGVAQTIESVSALYDVLGGADTVNLLITYDPATQSWRSYLGEASRGTIADTVLADHQGIIADMKTPVSLQLDGDALGSNGNSVITLHPGTNLVGMSLKDPRITHVSDLFALEGIRANVSTITVLNNGIFQTVEQAGNAGDIPITGGQSFILNAREETTVAISGQGWDNVSGVAAAAPVALTGIEVGNTTPVLALTGSIVSPVGEWGRMPHLRSGSGFRVIVKNLSTRKSVATVTGDTGGSYQLTVVDTETGGAAQIGDILEISVRSPDPRIGVRPLRHTVTAEDVKWSRIELDNLIAYEIPTETELLPNYPNPFNPETWIPYRLAEDAVVNLTIYDTAGRVVRSIDVGYKPAAVYESRAKAIHWDGRNDFGEQVASGVYFYHLSTGDFSATRKMLIIK